MNRTLLAALTALAVLAGCGDDDDSSSASSSVATTSPPTTTSEPTAEAAARKGTKLILRGSEFGRILFDSKKQAVYLFEKEDSSKPRCYGDCAEAWPPVFAKGKPRLGKGLKRSLLGTTRRRDGRRQITYGGHPLYYYAHEDPGEVLCHDVFLNGGLWLVLRKNGDPAPSS